MATKNIKKILLNKDGNKFVVDTENIVHSVNGVTPNEQGNVSITSVANANHATTADSATHADSAGSVAWTNVSGRPTNVSQFTNDSGYITNDHNFASGVKVSGYTITIG